MEKYKLALEIFDHPERFTDEQLREILNDKEILGIYNTLVAAETAAATEKPQESAAPRPRKSLWLHVAAVAAVAVTSAAAVAIVINGNRSGVMPSAVQAAETEIAETGPNAVIASASDTLTEKTDSTASSEIIIFRDRTLGEILKEMSARYGTEVRFMNPRVSELRLFFRWDRSLTAEQIVAQLNNFNKIDISISGNVITVK